MYWNIFSVLISEWFWKTYISFISINTKNFCVLLSLWKIHWLLLVFFCVVVVATFFFCINSFLIFIHFFCVFNACFFIFFRKKQFSALHIFVRINAVFQSLCNSVFLKHVVTLLQINNFCSFHFFFNCWGMLLSSE